MSLIFFIIAMQFAIVNKWAYGTKDRICRSKLIMFEEEKEKKQREMNICLQMQLLVKVLTYPK